jgi:hypothetical protein
MASPEPPAPKHERAAQVKASREQYFASL